MEEIKEQSSIRCSYLCAYEGNMSYCMGPWGSLGKYRKMLPVHVFGKHIHINNGLLGRNNACVMGVHRFTSAIHGLILLFKDGFAIYNFLSSRSNTHLGQHLKRNVI